MNAFKFTRNYRTELYRVHERDVHYWFSSGVNGRAKTGEVWWKKAERGEAGRGRGGEYKRVGTGGVKRGEAEEDDERRLAAGQEPNMERG